MTKEELEEEVKWRTKDQEELWERIDYLQECCKQKTDESKELLTATTQRLLETNSRLLALRRHSEGLEQHVQDMQKDIVKLKEGVKKRDSAIDAQKTYIETLHKLISNQRVATPPPAPSARVPPPPAPSARKTSLTPGGRVI